MLIVIFPIALLGVAFRACRRCWENQSPEKPSKFWWSKLGAVLAGASVCGVVVLGVAVSSGAQSVQDLAIAACSITALDKDIVSGFSTGASSGYPQDTFMGVTDTVTGVQSMSYMTAAANTTSVATAYASAAYITGNVSILSSHVNHLNYMMLVNGYSRIRNHRCRLCEVFSGYNATFPNTTGYATNTGTIGGLGLAATAPYVASTYLQAVNTGILTNGPSVSSTCSNAVSPLNAYATGLSDMLSTSLNSTLISVLKTLSIVFLALVAASVGLFIAASVSTSWSSYLARQSDRPFPSTLPLCVSWASFAFAASVVLLGAITVSLVLTFAESDLCTFTRNSLWTSQGFADYQAMLFKSASTQDQATAAKIADVCLARYQTDGTQTMILDPVGVTTALNTYISPITVAAVALNGVTLTSPPITSAMLTNMTTAASTLASVWLLDPITANTVNSNVSMWNTTVSAADYGPDAWSKSYLGLNSYAALINGVGSFGFLNGTSGGATIITTTTDPTSFGSLTSLQQNAIAYGVDKEVLLSYNSNLFRCDYLKADYSRQTVQCDYATFVATAPVWVANISTAVTNVNNAMTSYSSLITSTIVPYVNQVLTQSTALLEKTTCRFGWYEWRNIDQALCVNAPSAGMASIITTAIAAAAALVVLVLGYKAWRRLVDRETVSVELAYRHGMGERGNDMLTGADLEAAKRLALGNRNSVSSDEVPLEGRNSLTISDEQTIIAPRSRKQSGPSAIGRLGKVIQSVSLSLRKAMGEAVQAAEKRRSTVFAAVFKGRKSTGGSPGEGGGDGEVIGERAGVSFSGLPGKNGAPARDAQRRKARPRKMVSFAVEGGADGAAEAVGSPGSPGSSNSPAGSKRVSIESDTESEQPETSRSPRVSEGQLGATEGKERGTKERNSRKSAAGQGGESDDEDNNFGVAGLGGFTVNQTTVASPRTIGRAETSFFSQRTSIRAESRAGTASSNQGGIYGAKNRGFMATMTTRATRNSFTEIDDGQSGDVARKTDSIIGEPSNIPSPIVAKTGHERKSDSKHAEKQNLADTKYGLYNTSAVSVIQSVRRSSTRLQSAIPGTSDKKKESFHNSRDDPDSSI